MLGSTSAFSVLKTHGKYIGIIALLTLLVYTNSLENGFVFDGELPIKSQVVQRGRWSEIFTSEYWKGFYNLYGALYRPLTILSFAADYRLGGTHPWGYHLVNVLLHISNAILVYVLGILIFAQRGTACWAALFFGLHPIQTEAVANVAGRADLLATFFFLIALSLYIKGAIRRRSKQPTLALDVFSVLAFALALLSKESPITMIGVLLCYDLCFSPKGDLGIQRTPSSYALHHLIHRYGPYLGVIALYLAAKYCALGSVFLDAQDIGWVDNPIGAMAAYPRIATAVKIGLRYLILFVVPLLLCADYSYNQIPVSSSIGELEVLAAIVVVICLVGCWIGFYRVSKPAWFALSFFGVTFLIVSNIPFPIGTIMGERLLYMPSIGLCMLWGMLWYQCYNARRLRYIGIGLFCMVLTLYGYRTIRRNRDWKNEFTLFSSARKVSPNSVKVHHTLELAYREQGEPDKAIVHIWRMLQIAPDYAPAYSDLGFEYFHRGWEDEAMAAFKKAAQLDPQLVTALHNIGAIYLRQGLVDQAIYALRRALHLSPEHQETYEALKTAYRRKGIVDGDAISVEPGANEEQLYRLARTCEEQGQLKEAIIGYRKVLRLDPAHMESYNHLGRIYRDLGLFADALGLYAQALQAGGPDITTYNNMGDAFQDMKKLDEAVAAYRQAIQLQPESAKAYSGLGNVYRRKGRLWRARKALRKALTLQPDLAEAYDHLGRVYQAKKKWDKAIEAFNQAVALDPRFAATYSHLGDTYKEIGEMQKAQEAYHQAAAIDPYYAREE